MGGRIQRNGTLSNGGEAGWCPRCSTFVESGPDPCLGLIPGVSHACCGHGETRYAYVILGGRPNQSATEVETVRLDGVLALAFFALVEAGESEPATVEVG